jgi:cell filamentation protein
MIQDPYCYPGTNVLRNKFDLRDEDQLRTTEARVAAFALFVLQDEPPYGPIDEDRLRATHKAIFQEIYDWAGAYREHTDTMTKGREAGYAVTYGDSQFVPAEICRIFDELERENFLHGLSPDQFSARLAYFYSELDATHPFREGNSRTLRPFSTEVARSADYDLDWEPTGRTAQSRNTLYLARDLAFQRRNYAPLIAIIRSNLSP